MADPKPLSRAQLAKFLPDAEAIRTFEKLFHMVGETTPEDMLELSYLANTLKSRIQDADRKLAEIEILQARTMNLSAVLARLDELESQSPKRPGPGDLGHRVENLEKLIGV